MEEGIMSEESQEHDKEIMDAIKDKQEIKKDGKIPNIQD
jgi:hypothetical protein